MAESTFTDLLERFESLLCGCTIGLFLSSEPIAKALLRYFGENWNPTWLFSAFWTRRLPKDPIQGSPG